MGIPLVVYIGFLMNFGECIHLVCNLGGLKPGPA